MLFQIKSYLQFLQKSTNEHGVHSPFVYKLITECFYNKKSYKPYQTLDDYRNDLLKNDNTILIQDFGAGSKNLDNNQRKIARIAKNAGISKKRAQLLYRLVNYFNSKNILEIGTSLGIGTSALSLGNKNANIITLEGCPETAKVAQHQFEKYNLNNIHLKLGEFSKILPKVLEDKKYDLIYFDGNHQKQPTIEYFEQCLQHIHNDSVFIFDDIYWSKGMQEAWNYILKHPKVTVSIDTFRWGFVFFRKEQPKQHFTIRL